jgi:hypothetical protein
MSEMALVVWIGRKQRLPDVLFDWTESSEEKSVVPALSEFQQRGWFMIHQGMADPFTDPMEPYIEYCEEIDHELNCPAPRCHLLYRWYGVCWETMYETTQNPDDAQIETGVQLRYLNWSNPSRPNYIQSWNIGPRHCWRGWEYAGPAEHTS